jgi:GNAT superfamily N-acetyltransferase
MSSIEVQPVATRRDLRRFVKFPWRLYRDDPNWVPPLIAERIEYLDPAKGPFQKHADVALFLARRGQEVVGTIAAFVNHRLVERSGQPEGGFGFFEVINEYAVAERLLDAACAWLRAQGMSLVRGPTSFTNNEYPGVLIEGADCPPVMLEAHTPPYYKDFLERYGMAKDHDLFAWRAFRSQIGEELENIPLELRRVADVARQKARVTIRKVRLEEWDREVATARYLFNTTLSHLAEHVPLTEDEFRRLAGQLRPFLDPDLALFAEVDGKEVGFCIAIPDINRVLIHLNGRLFPLGWLKIGRYIRQVDVASFKLMGILEEYRRRGIDALLYLETIQAFFAKGYEWLDGSLTSECNPAINLIAQRLGAECYKRYRLYQMELDAR